MHGNDNTSLSHRYPTPRTKYLVRGDTVVEVQKKPRKFKWSGKIIPRNRKGERAVLPSH